MTAPTPPPPAAARRRRLLVGLAAFAVVSAGFVPAAGAQTTGAKLAIVSGMPATTTVGATGVGAFLSFTNRSDPSEGAVTIPANAIAFTPSCGVLPTAGPTCPTPDLGVFALSATASGRSGTDCAGQAFTITQKSATTGEVTFTGPAITLTASPPGSTNGGSCIIDFTFDVLKPPAIDADSAKAGTQTVQTVEAAGWHTAAWHTGTCWAAGETTVAVASPSITTQVSPAAINLGESFTDTATLAGGVAPTGTVTFAFYGPADTTCSGAPVFTSPSGSVNGDGPYTSAAYTPTATGTYRAIASYSGNATNAAVSTACNDSGESVVVSAVPSPSPSPTPVSSPTTPSSPSAAVFVPAAPTPTPSPSTTVLGTSFTKAKPTLPVTGPTAPLGLLGLLGLGLVGAGIGLLVRGRLRP